MNPADTTKETLRGVTPRRVLRAAAVLSAALLAGCTFPSQRVHHFDDDSGPLSASSGKGATIYENPGHKSGHITFGGNLLCVRKKGTVAVLEKPTYRAEVKPVKLEFWLRTFDPAKHKHTDRSRLAFISALGQPSQDFDQPYAGVYTRKIAGTKITAPCKRPEKAGFVDLLVVIKFDQPGGYLDGITINYQVGDKKYALDTRWRIGVCGTAVPESIEDGSCETDD